MQDTFAQLLNTNDESIILKAIDSYRELYSKEGIYDSYVYDALGRRIQSKNFSYFYIGDEEIGSFDEGRIKELKILSSTAPVAIEIEGKPYAITVDLRSSRD